MAEYIEREAVYKVINGTNSFSFSRNGMIEQMNTIPTADVIEVGSCDGCHWKGMGRFQKCTYCRRNRNLKDRFEERRGEGEHR